jgi:hypothetical protein
VAHGWFNRFRKLLVRYETLERSFLALNHLAAAIIVFRKIPMSVNIIYPVADELLDDPNMLCRLIVETALLMPVPTLKKSRKATPGRNK